MLLDGAVAAVIIGLIAGGRFSRLPALGLRWVWVFVAAFAIRLGVVALGAQGWAWFFGIARLFHVFSYLLLLAAVGANWRLWPMWAAALGVAMNLAVVAANGGAMPADASQVAAAGQQRLLELIQAGRYPTHTVLDAATRLPLLADRFLLPAPYPRPSLFSAGDGLLTAGVMLLILRGMGAFGWGRPAPSDGSSRCAAHRDVRD